MGNVTYHFYTRTRRDAVKIKGLLNKDIKDGTLLTGKIDLRHIVNDKSNFYAVTLEYFGLMPTDHDNINKYFEDSKNNAYKFYDGWDVTVKDSSGEIQEIIKAR